MKINKNKAVVGLAGISAISVAFAGMAGFNIGNQASAATATCNPSATTIAEAKCMQDINDVIIENMALETQYTLTDSRDGQDYYVAKLKDGNVWMTQNLGLSLASSVPLTSKDTDLNDMASAAYQNGYSVSSGLISWTPTRSTIDFDGAMINGWANSNTEPYSANKTNRTGTGHNSYGNYYNWTAAIASNNSESLNSSTIDNGYGNPKNSICPKGWRLPTIATVPSMNEFSRINELYNNGSSDRYSDLVTSPLYFSVPGILPASREGYFSYEGKYAEYWSSTIKDSDEAYGMILDLQHALTVQPVGEISKEDGASIRCVARTGISPEAPESDDKEAEEDSSIAVPNTGSNTEGGDSSNGSILIATLSVLSITTAIAAIACKTRAKNHRKFDL